MTETTRLYARNPVADTSLGDHPEWLFVVGDGDALADDDEATYVESSYSWADPNILGEMTAYGPSMTATLDEFTDIDDVDYITDITVHLVAQIVSNTKTGVPDFATELGNEFTSIGFNHLYADIFTDSDIHTVDAGWSYLNAGSPGIDVAWFISPTTLTSYASLGDVDIYDAGDMTWRIYDWWMDVTWEPLGEPEDPGTTEVTLEIARARFSGG